MGLDKINKILRTIGFVLVVGMDVDGDGPTKLWLESARKYDARTQK
jgi:hypothetical protein